MYYRGGDAVGVGGARPYEAHVLQAAAERRELRRGIEHREPHLDRRATRPEPPERLRQDAAERRRDHVAQVDGAGLAAARSPDGRLGALELAERDRRFAEQRLAGLSQRHGGASAAVQEPGAEAALELLQVAAERRLGDVESLGRAPEVQLLGDRDEVTEGAAVERRGTAF